MPSDRSWTAPLAIVMAVTLVVVSGTALAHGGTIERTRQVGPYTVQFLSVDQLTTGESFGTWWNVTDRDTGGQLDLNQSTVEIVWRDEAGTVLDTETKTPTYNEGFGIFLVAVETRNARNLTYTLQFEDREVSFSQDVLANDPPNGGTNGNDDEPPPSTPLPAWTAPLALAGAAVGLALLGARRRRGG